MDQKTDSNLDTQITLTQGGGKDKGKDKDKDKDKNGPPKQIGVRLTLDSLKDVSTANQSFSASFLMTFRWLAEENDIKTFEEATDSWEPKFKPKISFRNAIGKPEVQNRPGKDSFYSIVEAENEKFVEYTFLCESEFMEPFKLRAFPFDCQDLSIIIELGNKGGADKYVLVPDRTTHTFIKFNLSSSVLTEWILRPPMVEFGFSKSEDSKTGTVRPQFIVKLKLQRNFKFYLNRVILFLAILSLLNICSFANTVDNVADRLSVDFTLLLSLVAYQLVISSFLPMLSFLTYIDLYITGIILYVCVISVEHALLGYLTSQGIGDVNVLTDIDHYFFYICVAIWVGVHAGFAIYIPFLIRKEERKMTMGTLELQKTARSFEKTEGGSVYFLESKVMDPTFIEKLSRKEFVPFITGASADFADE